MQKLNFEEEGVIRENSKILDRIYEILKRLIDVIGSIFGIIILFPLLIIVGVLIKFESKGPIFFSQERVGLNGQKFRMYKFRSMVEEAEKYKKHLLEQNEMNGPMFKIKNDPRVTKVGKFIRHTSIDEIPQLLNILKGEMSFVGPRPSLPEEVRRFNPWMMERLTVKPGLTCYWQVLGRNDIQFEEWMKLDIKYIKERSILLDAKLIILTFFVLFGDKHAR